MPFHRWSRRASTLIFIAAVAAPARAAPLMLAEALTDLSLEELANVQVTSVSKKSQRLADAPAAVFVITQDDIRRSGVTCVPEALRLAPGVEVARIDASKWAISARGMNARFANKLLVLLDGRSIYTQLFSGVYWDAHDVLLEDIERIEVIRGPGATLWGANAVNGVINIITKRPRDTQGGLLSATVGTQDRAIAGARYGAASEDGAWRIHAKAFERAAGRDADGHAADDDWRMARLGFRFEHGAHLTLEAEAFTGTEGYTARVPRFSDPGATPPFFRAENAPVADDLDTQGAHLLARWTHADARGGEYGAQAYWDYADYSALTMAEKRHTLDLEFQHRLGQRGAHELIWGLSYRANRSETGVRLATFDPAERSDHLISAFLQDEITLVPGRWRLTLGSKFEHHRYSGFELQPNIRFLHTPNDTHSLWASVARAARTPARADREVFINSRAETLTVPPGIPVAARITGGGTRDFEAETLTAYEFGWRLRANSTLSFDLAAFYNEYRDLRTLERARVDNSTLPVVVDFRTANMASASSHGLEAVADWRPASWWRLHAAWTWLHLDVRHAADSRDSGVLLQGEGASPRSQFSLRSSMDLGGDTEFDVWAKYVGALRDVGVSGYTMLNARLGWKLRPDIEVALVGQNLLDDRHLEFQPELFSFATAVPRSVHATLHLRF
ncbi:TonB-dependent receptor plug domain-containing protein [Aromatoleum evansii]|uniref:TonB-dependent receptor plug domain-containing protein n=1 Tax=Aromatoleum evansii TaxID=59406 RepID=UPI00145D694A|nr:TonB-dependent receptor [Aromatoleum evansii]NMG31615.1 TonB-dependent receptor [Aromatoleum evansii]